MKRNPRSPAAFTLTEILSVLIMLAVVGLVSARLFRATMRVIDDAPASQDAIATSEAMLRQLRADCWTAHAMTSATNDQAEIRTRDGKAISWRVSESTITRTEGDQVATWPLGDLTHAGRWSFGVEGVEGAVLVLQADQARITLSSEVTVLNRGKAP